MTWPPDLTGAAATMTTAGATGLASIGIITDELDADLAGALETCRSLGLEHVELRMLGGRSWLDADDHEFSRAVGLIRTSGLTLDALASPIFKCSLPGTHGEVGALHGARAGATIDESWAMLDLALERAAAAGVPFVRVFSFWRVADPTSVFEATVEALQEALRRADQYPVELLLENEHDCNIATAEETVAVLERLPGLRLIWDPANHVRAGGEPLASALSGHAHRIAHVHVKDVADDGSWAVVGEGRVPFDLVLRELGAVGYAGSYSFETHCRVDGSVVLATERSLGAFRALLESA